MYLICGSADSPVVRFCLFGVSSLPPLWFWNTVELFSRSLSFKLCKPTHGKHCLLDLFHLLPLSLSNAVEMICNLISLTIEKVGTLISLILLLISEVEMLSIFIGWSVLLTGQITFVVIWLVWRLPLICLIKLFTIWLEWLFLPFSLVKLLFNWGDHYCQLVSLSCYQSISLYWSLLLSCLLRLITVWLAWPMLLTCLFKLLTVSLDLSLLLRSLFKLIWLITTANLSVCFQQVHYSDRCS